MNKIFQDSKLHLLCLILVFALSSCLKDNETFTEYPDNPWANLQKIELDVSGEIIDEQGNPVKDVLITSNDKTTLTDKNGVFVIKKTQQAADFIHIKAEKKGYFNGARVIRGRKDKQNTVKIILLAQKKVLSFKSSVGGNITIEGVKLNFPVNGYIDAAGKTFSGNVNVAAKYLDPTKIETLLKMPGDLRATNFQGEEKFLESYGMVAVELTDDSGNKLNLGNGGQAELSFKKPAKFQARTEIPFWYFDEKIGAWREEGKSILNDKGEYVGKVSHFSFWNCDFPYDKVFAKGRIVDQNGNPMAGVWVGVDLVGQPWGGHGQAGNDGVFMGCIPKGMDLELKVRGLIDSCGGKILYSKVVGSFMADVDFGDITVNIGPSTNPVKTFNGIAVDCAGNKLVNGYVSVSLKGLGTVRQVNLFTDADGKFQYTITPNPCYADVTSIDVAVFDLTNKKTSPIKTFPLNAGANPIGTIEVCTKVDEFIDLKFGDSTFYSILPNGEIYMSKDSVGGQSKDVLSIYLSDQNSFKQRFLQFSVAVTSNPPTLGTYPLLYNYGFGVLPGGTSTFPPSAQNMTITFTEISLVTGNYVAATIAGTITPTAGGQPINVSGGFRLKKR